MVAVVALAVLVLDPLGFFGPRFEYGEAEMRAAVVGRWHATVNGRDYDLAIDQATDRDLTRVESHGWVPTAGACGTRSLIKEAGACGDGTQMPLIVADSEGRLARGDFIVPGLSFRDGWLKVDSDGLRFEVTLDAHGNVVETSLGAKLVRVSMSPTH